MREHLLITPALRLFARRYLALTNQTTREVVKRGKLWYTSKLPDGVYPFSGGVRVNIRQFFCPDPRGIEWLEPQPPWRADQQCWLLENEYYSCC